MIISYNGSLGAGKSTIAEKIAKKLNFKHYYMGQVLRDLSKEKGMDFIDFMKLAEIDSSIDNDIDEYVKKLGKKEDDFVIESRTAWHFIPDSVKIFLTVNEKEGARRIHKQLKKEKKNKRNERIKSFDEFLADCQRRSLSEQKRYQKYYGINPRDLENYDFVLDTTNLTPEEVFWKNLDFLKKLKTKN
jgi:cytidylate kinase